MEHLAKFSQWLSRREGEAGDGSVQNVVLDSSGSREEHAGRLLQFFGALLEYEQLDDLVPPGMYLLPSDCPLMWQGVLFARQGLYRGGIFKFEVRLPPDYPDKPPTIHFVTDIYHPMVEPSTGAFDVDAFFSEWLPGRDFAVCVLPHLYRALLRREYFAGSRREALNPEAREMFLKDPAEFGDRAKASVIKSVEDAQEVPPGWTLQFACATDDSGPDSVLAALQDHSPVGSFEHRRPDRKANFVNWFLETYSANPESEVPPSTE